jgi:outer membrane protein, multidrug efflux system
VTGKYRSVANDRRGVALRRTASRRVLAAKFLLAASFGLSLSGCSVGDEYQRPETGELARWRTMVNGQHAWPTPTWWRKFHSRRLDTVMRLAMERNFDIAAAIDRIRQADAQVIIARAPLLPLVTGDGQAARSQTPSSGSGFSSGPLVRNNVQFQFNASYEIDFWGKNRAAYESAEAQAAASRFDERTVQISTQASVASTYFAILGAHERIKVARENVKNATGVLQAIKDRREAGTANALDVAQQENVVATQEATIPPMEQGLQQNFNALALLCGSPPHEIRTVPDTLSSLKLPIIQPGLPSDLLQRRPDVQFAEAQLVAANGNITVARAQLFPTIQLTGGFGWESTALGTLLRNRNLLWNVASSVTQTIFDAGKLQAGVNLDVAKYSELTQNYRKTVIQAFVDTENALIAVKQTGEEVKALEKAVSTAQIAFNIANDQLRAGLIDITTMLNTQRALFNAQDALASSRINRAQAVVGLYKALGGGWLLGTQGDELERTWVTGAIPTGAAHKDAPKPEREASSAKEHKQQVKD